MTLTRAALESASNEPLMHWLAEVCEIVSCLNSMLELMASLTGHHIESASQVVVPIHRGEVEPQQLRSARFALRLFQFGACAHH